jgi:hypothetical protein
MKKLKPALLFFAVSILLINSCKKDDTDVRDKFVGSYSISETWTSDGGGSGTDSYAISISKSGTDAQKIIIENLANTINEYGSKMNVIGTVSGNSIAIATQSIAVGVYSVTVTGTGALNDKLLTISYIIVGQWQGTCTGFKQ